MAKKVVPAQAGRKVSATERAIALAERRGATEAAKAAEARRWLETHEAEYAALPPAEASGSALDGEAARRQKKLRDQEREAYRVPRDEAPSGYRYSDDGSIESTDGPTLGDVLNEPRRPVTRVDEWMASKLQALLELATSQPARPPREAILPPGAGSGRGFQMTPTGIAPLENVEAGQLAHAAPVRALGAIRRAYVAATGRTPEDEWQYRLRLHVEHALHDRQGKRVLRKNDNGGVVGRKSWAGTDGATVLELVKAGSPPGTVPRGLTAKSIEEILTTATLGRGGGNKQAKRRTNVVAAVDALIARILG